MVRQYFAAVIDKLFVDLNEKNGSLFKEDLSLLENRTIAVDADILLRKAKANPLKSLQEGHAGLDMTLQQSLIDIILKFKQHKIDLLIVLDGLKPKYLCDEEKVLRKSQMIWDTVQNNTDQTSLNRELKDNILSQYGVNAAQITQTQFFVAPYLSSPQIVYFHQEELVHACAGSSKILLYDCEQVIVDFDFEKKTFSYIDKIVSNHFRNDFIQEMFKTLDIHVKEHTIQTYYLIDLFILCVNLHYSFNYIKGAIYNKKITTFSKCKISEIIKQMNEVEKNRDPNSSNGKPTAQILIESEAKFEQKLHNIELLKVLRSFLIDAPPILNMQLELVNLRRNSKNDFIFSDFQVYMGNISCQIIINIGPRFNDEIYYYMSRGLIEPSILETIINKQILPTILLAPNLSFVEAWESNDFKGFYQQIFQNLQEDSEEEKKFLNDDRQSMLRQFYDSFKYVKEERYHFKWNLQEADIQKELERQDYVNEGQNQVSFTFAMKWFDYDIVRMQNKKSSLLKYIATEEEISINQMEKVKTQNEIQVMTYLHFLEQRGYLGMNKEYLYGRKLKQATNEDEQAVLLFLEMLKIFYPAGLEIPAIEQHQEFQSKWNLLRDKQISESDKCSILLITRIFTLMPMTSNAINQGKEFELRDHNQLDFDLSMFGTYLRKIKFLMKGMFQSLMYRLYRSNRGDINQFGQTLKMQAFNKENNHLFGYIFKTALATLHEQSQLPKDHWQQFESFVTFSEINENLHKACDLWKIIYQLVDQLIKEDKVSEALKNQFENAHNYLLQKLEQMGYYEIAAELKSDETLKISSNNNLLQSLLSESI
ncbi:UNKNOWN [Stylonychia lemnae]|uniref:Uncharacterized protein n=1 Tax=Stylonychia lemnae TaxID=5949 RepID=A0A078AP06_STYLE|nr:UNKNOWN [Stylonychia lemnae]|eukprot:CDW83047.1 UNKNOWN [Stylonychia lemnae]